MDTPPRTGWARVAIPLALFAVASVGFVGHAYRGVGLRCDRAAAACTLREDFVLFARTRSIALGDVERLSVAPQLPGPERSVSRLSRRYRLILETSDEDVPVSRRHVAAEVEPWLARFAGFSRGEGAVFELDLDARPDAFGIVRWAAGMVAMVFAMLFVAARMRAKAKGAP